MLELKKLAEEFIEGDKRSFKTNFPGDDTVIEAINDTGAGRIELVRKWLISYKVLHYYSLEDGRNIAEQVVKFADNRTKKDLDQDKDLVIQEFSALGKLILTVAPLAPKSGKPRELTSLTSKALWCCYPYDVPIFDNYTKRALQVISRICGLKPEPSHSGYGAFVDVWFQVYDEIKPILGQEKLSGFTYKVRVLDWLLWDLGQPSFETRK